MRLREISPESYARDVLPSTAPLWAGNRSFDEYVAQTLELANSRYGRRHFRTLALYDGRTLVSSVKRYERALHHDARRLAGVGFGAVFTPDEHRGHGFATFMLAAALDAARRDGYDLAYLFSDIRPQFYAELGFRELRSRRLTLRADALPSRRLQIARIDDDDWASVARCFDAGERRRVAGFLRSKSIWDRIAVHASRGSEHSGGQMTNLAVRRGRGIRAYVLGIREPERDSYVLEEAGFAHGAAETMPALLRAAAGDLRRVIGWLPPEPVRQALPRGSARERTRGIFMLAPLTVEGELLFATLAQPSRADFCWSTDHI